MNGFIEEMANGQKVVKVFNHEKQSSEDFKNLNQQLFNDSCDGKSKAYR